MVFDALSLNGVASTCVDPTITPAVPGCTDSTATNYDPLATLDDGSCIAAVAGCTDTLANNYNALANTDDGSCAYDPLLITATVCDTTGVTSVRFTGPWWNWDPNGGPVGTSNGDGTWTFSLPGPVTCYYQT